MLEWLLGKSFDPEKDIPSLDGKVILVTGGTCKLNDPAYATLMSSTGNAGLGKETILQLAKHHPKRNLSRGENATESRRCHPGNQGTCSRERHLVH